MKPDFLRPLIKKKIILKNYEKNHADRGPFLIFFSILKQVSFSSIYLSYFDGGRREWRCAPSPPSTIPVPSPPMEKAPDFPTFPSPSPHLHPPLPLFQSMDALRSHLSVSPQLRPTPPTSASSPPSLASISPSPFSSCLSSSPFGSSSRSRLWISLAGGLASRWRRSGRRKLVFRRICTRRWLPPRIGGSSTILGLTRLGSLARFCPSLLVAAAAPSPSRCVRL